MMSTENKIISNPFNDMNADNIDTKRICDLWCDPFGVIELQKEEFCSESNKTLIIEGSRGSGKTMILKHFSYEVQKENAKRNETTFIEQIRECGGIGFYHRFERPEIDLFQKTFETFGNSKYKPYFKHGFELEMSMKILKMFIELTDKGEISIENYEKEIVNEIVESCVGLPEVGSFEEMYTFVRKEYNCFKRYRNNELLFGEPYRPAYLFDVFDIGEKIIVGVKKHDPTFKNISFMYLLDEFENLQKELQVELNKIIRSRSQIKFRIGRRIGSVSETANSEYLRINHDYRPVNLDRLDFHKYMTFFEKIAETRMSTKSFFGDKYTIKSLLGSSEDLIQESLNKSGGNDNHIRLILRDDAKIKNNPKLLDELITIIRNKENPIAEMLNALWVIRNKQNYIATATRAANAMKLFFSQRTSQRDDNFSDEISDDSLDWEDMSEETEKKERNEEIEKDVIKYKNDYVNKYKYSLTVLLCSAYKKRKSYYSFGTICHLSNYNVRNFINILKMIIDEAIYKEPQVLEKGETISYDCQDSAIKELSFLEFKNICDIMEHGQEIRNFIHNIGGVLLRAYYLDKKVRYPESNQFILDYSELSDKELKIIDISKKWSMIIERSPKRESPGVSKLEILCYINKMFSPIFDISYRIRGGQNIRISSKQIQEMISSNSFKFSLETADSLPEGQTTLRIGE